MNTKSALAPSARECRTSPAQDPLYGSLANRIAACGTFEQICLLVGKLYMFLSNDMISFSRHPPTMTIWRASQKNVVRQKSSRIYRAARLSNVESVLRKFLNCGSGRSFCLKSSPTRRSRPVSVVALRLNLLGQARIWFRVFVSVPGEVGIKP